MPSSARRPLWSLAPGWGPKLFLGALAVVLVFFWWLLIWSGGAAPHHG